MYLYICLHSNVCVLSDNIVATLLDFDFWLVFCNYECVMIVVYIEYRERVHRTERGDGVEGLNGLSRETQWDSQLHLQRSSHE